MFHNQGNYPQPAKLSHRQGNLPQTNKFYTMKEILHNFPPFFTVVAVFRIQEHFHNQGAFFQL